MVNIVCKSQDYSLVNKTKDNLSCLTLKCEKTFHNHCLLATQNSWNTGRNYSDSICIVTSLTSV